ncbi:MAG: hypothetical protein JWM11_144, partial [Planctomycetaceae bacterium]|nr:hypothetical protein [Planctomycetaceae bacterium]
MIHCVRFVVVSVLAFWIAAPAILIAAQTVSVVGRTAGHLAVREADRPWRVIPAGGILPDHSECRTSADGPCQMFLGEEHGLFLGPLSHVKYDLVKRRVHVISGRLFCTAPEAQTWNIVAGDAQIEVTAAGVEVVRKSDREFQVSTLRGSARVLVPNAEPVTLAEKSSRSWLDNKGAGESAPMSKTQVAGLAIWTKPTPPGQGPGQLVITDPQSKSQTRLAIARYHAELVLSPPVALVKLDQAFYNPSERQEEGEFVFNLPPGASVSRFAMYVTPTSLIEGEIIDRQRANSIYSEIVRKRRDPAILEKIGDNLFRMRVFPIFPRDIKRILLDYTLPLYGQSEQYHVQLPLLSDLEPIWDFRIHGTIQGPTPLNSVSSPTHPELKFVAKGDGLIGFDFARHSYLPTSDLMLAFQQSLPEQPATFRRLVAPPLKLKITPQDHETSLSQFVTVDPQNKLVRGPDPWNDQAATYFLAELPTKVDPAATAPADVLVLLETSSAMETLGRVRPALQSVISGLRQQDRLR